MASAHAARRAGSAWVSSDPWKGWSSKRPLRSRRLTQAAARRQKPQSPSHRTMWRRWSWSAFTGTWNLGRLPRSKRLGNGGRDLVHVGPVAILRARPKKSTQSVLRSSRYDMRVEVRHRLTNDVVHRNEASMSLKGSREGLGYISYSYEKWLDEVFREIWKSPVMVERDDQTVTEKQGALVEKHDLRVGASNHRGGDLLPNDGAKDTTHLLVIARFSSFGGIRSRRFRVT